MSTQADPQDLGQLKYRGLLSGSISYYGHPAEALRQGLQAALYARESPAVRSHLLELDHFRLCGGEAIRTNLVNRLAYAASDLYAISEPRFPVHIGHLLRQWEASRAEAESGHHLLALVDLLDKAQARTAPLHHDLYVWGKAPHLGKPAAKAEDKEEDKEEEAATIGHWTQAQAADPPELAAAMQLFIHHFEQRDPRCLQAVETIHRLKTKATVRFRGWRPSYREATAGYPMGGRSRPEYALWEYLLDQSDPETDRDRRECLEELFESYMRRSDPEIYLVHALHYWLETPDWGLDTQGTDKPADTVLPTLDHGTFSICKTTSLYPDTPEVEQVRRLLGGGTKRGGKRRGKSKIQKNPVLQYADQLEEEPIPL